MKNKIITLLLIIFFSVTILNLNEVFGVGLVSQCWKYDVNGDGKQDLVYRVFTTPTQELVESFTKNKKATELISGWTFKYNGKNYNAKWKYLLDSTQATTSRSTFLTVKYAFHKEPLSDYSTSGNIGYASSNVVMTDALPSITECVANATAVMVKPKKANDYNSDNVFFELERITGEYKTVTWGTKETLTGTKFNKNTQFRQAIIDVGSGTNVLVYDHVIYNDDLIKLVATAKQNGKTDGCYVSQVLISKAYGSGQVYEVSKTMTKFLEQHDKTWSKSVMGRKDRALGAVANLYDNELIFPQMSKRTVLVRHINIGNNTTISPNIIANESNIMGAEQLKSIGIREPKIKVGDIDVSGKLYSNTYEDYSEYYEEIADVDKIISKNSLEDTDKYRCLGYNVSKSLTHDAAKADIADLIAKGQYTPGKEVTIPGKTDQGDSEYIIIDFYYTEYEKDVVVNHYYTDKNGNVKELGQQTIVPNTTANEGTIARINDDRYIKEVYPRKFGQSITVTKASSISGNSSIIYQGYQLFTQQEVDEGKTVGIGEQGYYDSTETETTLYYDDKTQEDFVQVNFYYTIESTVELIEPERELEGKVFVNRQQESGETKNITTTCTDTTEAGQTYDKVTSIPSGSYGVVGIKDIPKYMVGAITSEYVSPASKVHRMNLTINLTMGKQENKTIKLENIPYRVGYYKITDMAVYKLTDANVYDAGAKGVDTFGDGLFNWDEKALTVNNMNYNVSMTGIGGRTITNNNINDINNYVSAQITGKSPATNIAISSEKNSMNSTIPIQYINEEEFNKVDANEDSAITEHDKIFAQNKLEEYSDKLEVAISEEATAENEYNNAVQTQNKLKVDYDNAVKQLENLQKTYNNSETERLNKYNKVSQIEQDIKKLEEQTIPALEARLEELQEEYTALGEQLEELNSEIATLEQELEKLRGEHTLLTKELEKLKDEHAKLEDDLDMLKADRQTSENSVNTAREALNNVEQTTKNSQQYREWQNSISERERLRQAADCTDSVDEEEYIYLDEHEKDALNQCAEAKAAYQKHLEDRVVEVAQETYENYLDQQKRSARNNLNEAEATLENIIQQINLKHNEIDAKQIEIDNKQSGVDAKKLEFDGKQLEVNNKQSEIDDKQTEVDDKQSEVDNKQSEVDNKRSEILSIKVILTMGQQDYNNFVKDYWTPAKEEYFNYKDNKDSEYNIAKSKYDEFVENKYVDTAYDNWREKLNAKNKAQSQYDSYKTYKETLDKLYDSYKAMYDEFITLTNENAAEKLGLNLNITVQNMSIKFEVENEQEIILTKSTKNSETDSFKVSDLQKITDEDDKNIPQVYTDPIKIEQDTYNNIFYNSETKKLVNESDYSADKKGNINDYIKKEILNGVRVLAGDVEYSPITVIGSKKASAIVDNLYYNQDKTNSSKEINTFNIATQKLTKKYEWDKQATEYSDKYKDVEPVNIYTPITVSAELNSDTNQIVDQTQNIDTNKSLIQLNTSFTIELGNDKEETNYQIDDTKKYVKGYYIKFDFEVHNVYINGKKYKNGARIPSNVWLDFIYPKNGKATVQAQAYGNLAEDGLDIISEDNGSYTVRAVAYNATDIMRNESIRYATLQEMRDEQSGLKNIVYNICTDPMNLPSYFAQTEENTLLIINRVFDFRVTDVKDLNWKSVFRKSSGSNVNNHSGVVYNSGITKWDTSSDESNSIIPRTTAEIGKNPLRILPIGPYKNTNSTYIKAPKLGYRFSFDLKVTGSYYNKNGTPRENKKVDIATRFYYISKDGKTHLKESDGTSTGIYLFYKNANGKYVKIDQDGGGYNLTFTPNDGYRYLDSGDDNNLSKSLVNIGNLRKLTLTHEMATVANNGVVITYYGEYKLPNSTIAVEVKKDETTGKISYDINKPLKNGYIGVVFDIVVNSGANAENEVELSYSKKTKKDTANTSQWDYEGYLGYKNGSGSITSPLSIKLEKGVWKIDNQTYNDIKGSVILYDIDERAATDYE